MNGKFVPRGGQVWTTPEKLAGGTSTRGGNWRGICSKSIPIRNSVLASARCCWRTPQDNVLWDCLSLLDDATISLIRALGGLRAIAISHPHYYTRMQDWARALTVPFISTPPTPTDHASRSRDPPLAWRDAGNRARRDPAQGRRPLSRLARCFTGLTVPSDAGAILSGDIVQVAADLGRVSFLWSYPNMMPLSAATVRRIADTLAPWRFDRILRRLSRTSGGDRRCARG